MPANVRAAHSSDDSKRTKEVCFGSLLFVIGGRSQYLLVVLTKHGCLTPFWNCTGSVSSKITSTTDEDVRTGVDLIGKTSHYPFQKSPVLVLGSRRCMLPRLRLLIGSRSCNCKALSFPEEVEPVAIRARKTVVYHRVQRRLGTVCETL